MERRRGRKRSLPPSRPALKCAPRRPRRAALVTERRLWHREQQRELWHLASDDRPFQCSRASPPSASPEPRLRPCGARPSLSQLGRCRLCRLFRPAGQSRRRTAGLQWRLQQAQSHSSQTLEALSNALARLQRVTDNVPVVVFEYCLSPGGHRSVPFVSQRFRELTGLDPAPLAGRGTRGEGRGIRAEHILVPTLRADNYTHLRRNRAVGFLQQHLMA